MYLQAGITSNKYFLFSLLIDDLGDLADFAVYVELEHRGTKTHVSFVKAVIVHVYGYWIKLTKEGLILVSHLLKQNFCLFNNLNSKIRVLSQGNEQYTFPIKSRFNVSSIVNT